MTTAQTTAFVGVNVIPMDRERVLANQTMIVRKGAIAEIGDTKKVKIPKDALRVDAAGKYLIPGLVDMHTHLLSDSNEYPDSIALDEGGGVAAVLYAVTRQRSELRRLSYSSQPNQIVQNTLRAFRKLPPPRVMGNLDGFTHEVCVLDPPIFTHSC